MSEVVMLRPAAVTNLPAIRQLMRAAYAKWVPLIGRESKPMTADYAKALQQHVIDLLYVDGDLAGLIETIPGLNHLLIENVAVSPSFQGRGLSRNLIAHAEDAAAAHGYRHVRLYTNKLFAENLRLYEKLGDRWERESEFKGGFVVHMNKLLRSPAD